MSTIQKWQTEMRNPATTHIDKMTTAEMAACIQLENENAVHAVGKALLSIEKACDCIAERLSLGGRLIYIGAGSSGRLGVLDAVECPPTYGVPQSMVIGIIAGGPKCMFQAAEKEEDDAINGIQDMQALNLTEKDVPEILMVGDRKFDVLGAREFGIDCVGVEFFGYAAPGELTEAGAIAVVDSAEALERFILSH